MPDTFRRPLGLLTVLVLLAAAATLPAQKEPDPAAAVEELQARAAKKDQPDHPYVLHDLGRAQRTLGLRKAAHDRAAADRHFEAAAAAFADAAREFAARATPPAGDAAPPSELEWAACCRCCLAEVQLRLGKTKDARDTAATLLSDAALRRSRYRTAALFYQGVAAFRLGDPLTAGRSLNLLAPWDDAIFGAPARYLLGRVHTLQDERVEAALHFEALLAEHAERKKTAAEALQQPDAFKDDDAGRARAQALLEGPPPEPVVRAGFCLAVLLYENGSFNEARNRFAEVAAQPRLPALHDEARLCQGFCEVQLSQFNDAAATLKPLAEKESSRTGQALLWLGKAQVGLAPADDADARQQALEQAAATLRRAADWYAKRPTDPDARTHQGEALLERADAQHRAGRHQEAAALLARVLRDGLLPGRREEVLQRQVTALNLAGDWDESDRLCEQFFKEHSKSLLAAEVHFRHAENAGFRAAAGGKDAARLNEEAARRYQTVVERFPEFEQVNLARYGLAQAHYRRDDYDRAREVLETIAAPDRTGELAVVPYHLADCLIRLAPAKADDALAAGRLREQFTTAAQLLEGFAASQAESPLVPDALLRLGFCRQRLAAQLAQPEEQKQLRDAARASHEALLLDYPLHELQPHAALERCRHLTQPNANVAIARLRRLTTGSLDKAPTAPLAALQLATLLRNQENGAGEAAALLARIRKQHEKALLADPARAGWVPLLQYHHAVALKEAGRPAEARGLFEALLRQYPERPEADEAALRRGQCLWDEGWQATQEANQKLGAPDVKPEEAAAANKAIEEAAKLIQAAPRYLEEQAARLKERQPVPEVRARMLYEAAWAYRTLGDEEAAKARGAMADVPPEKVALQPAEKKARALFEELLASFPDLPLALEARLQLAEWLGDRSADYATAVKLLTDGLDREPPADLTDRLRLRLAACHAARGDGKAALRQWDVLTANPQGPLAGQAQYRAAEYLMEKEEWAAAVKRLAVFRDQEAFQNLGGLSDLALLRLGHALARLKQEAQARKVHELLLTRFPDSSWAPAAHYGVGWVRLREQKVAEAAEAFTQAAADMESETAAKALLQVGVCRMEQKKYAEAAEALAAVAAKNAYPELAALARIEAAAAHARLKQPDEAEKLLRQVLQDNPEGKWAEVAKGRLKAPAAGPLPHELPEAGRLLAPDVAPPGLEALSGYQADRTPLDDPTEEASLAFALSRKPPERAAPAAAVRPTVPDPFEYRHAVRGKVPPEEDRLAPELVPAPPGR